MSRRFRLSGRASRLGLALAVLLAGALGMIDQNAFVAAQETPLLVNDEQTANPDLVEVAVADPGGFGVSGRTLLAPEGYTVSVIGAGLDEPRFMTFDEAGNLIVTSANEGAIYRYPFAAGQLGEPEPLITGLSWPASVALICRR
jgi:hypothetical protein